MTKGITIIKKDKKVKMCQYGSSDGYPSGQGQDLIDVLHKYGIDNIKNKTHPTEKPWQLPANYIENSSLVGDKILDPFMGTGSTGEACARLGREFVGIEIDQSYYDIARNRLNG